jgi:hypothetical protein
MMDLFSKQLFGPKKLFLLCIDGFIMSYNFLNKGCLQINWIANDVNFSLTFFFLKIFEKIGFIRKF